MEIDEMVAKQKSGTKEVEQKKYTYDEVYKKTLEYFNGDELAARVWATKYALKDSFGNIYGGPQNAFIEIRDFLLLMNSAIWHLS